MRRAKANKEKAVQQRRRMPQTRRSRLPRLLWLTASAIGLAALAPLPAAADRVYHSAHLNFEAVGGPPLRSGFVENIKAEGPRIYAHEIFVLNGARARTTYTVTRDFFFQDPKCAGELVFHEQVATLRTNASGNARGDAFVEPADVAGFAGVHGVTWTVRDAAGAVAYRTTCNAVTLD
jgi:hypothetical protein